MRACSAALLAVAIAPAALSACDQGTQHDLRRVGPPVHVVATNFGDGKTVPANGSVVIAFDRVLDPASVNRQAAVIVEVGGRAVGNPSVAYDPVTRLLSLSGPNALGSKWLTPGLPYEVVLTDASDPTSIGGVRALDGAPLELEAPRRLAFFAGPEVDDVHARGFEPETEFCRDVLPIFRAKCNGGPCHSTPQESHTLDSRFPDGMTRPAQGLVLTTSVGVANTALRRPAQEANTGSRGGLSSAPGRVFGVNMAVIEPGNPASSWLMYKVMMARPGERFGPSASSLETAEKRCDGSPGRAPVALGDPLARFVALDEDERSRLADALLGSSMPYPDPVGGSENLTYEELGRLRSWIAQGAHVTECGACLP